MMTVEVVNGKLVQKRFQDLDNAIPKVGRLQIYQAMQRVSKRIGEYPNEPTASKYERTYALRKGRRVDKIDNGYTFSIDAVDPKRGTYYPIYVIGNLSGYAQAWMMTHWTPLVEVTAQEFEKVPAEVVDKLSFYTTGQGASNDGID